MNLSIRAFFILFLLTFYHTIKGQNLVNSGRTDSFVCSTPTLIARQFKFTEGPAQDRHGNIYFTDQPNNQIWKYDIHGRLSLYMEPAGRANGMCFDRKGNLLVCADQNNQLWSINLHKKVKILIKDFSGLLLNGPNDLWVDKKGGVYFTDPYYPRAYWTRVKVAQMRQRVYYLAPKAKEARIVIDDLEKPNGVFGSADGKHLFVADIQGNKTYQYTIGEGGNLFDKKVFVNQGADGITLDQHNNLYLCGNGVTVYDSTGRKIQHIPIPEPWTSNISFGGKDHNQLFITASTAIYLVTTNQQAHQ